MTFEEPVTLLCGDSFVNQAGNPGSPHPSFVEIAL